MRIFGLILLLCPVLLSSCSLDPGHTVYTNVVIPVNQRSVPETGNVDVPVNIYVSAFADNGCWSDIHFIMDQKSDLEYDIWALADFESAGVCPEVIVTGDTTVTFTPDRTGEYLVKFWMTPYEFESDTIVVGGTPPEK